MKLKKLILMGITLPSKEKILLCLKSWKKPQTKVSLITTTIRLKGSCEPRFVDVDIDFPVNITNSFKFLFNY